jgi:hypothetical protein
MGALRQYVLKRLLVAIPSLLIASLVVFTLPRLIPGDVVQLMLEEKAYGKDLDDLRAKLGLDQPIRSSSSRSSAFPAWAASCSTPSSSATTRSSRASTSSSSRSSC